MKIQFIFVICFMFISSISFKHKMRSLSIFRCHISDTFSSFSLSYCKFFTKVIRDTATETWKAVLDDLGVSLDTVTDKNEIINTLEVVSFLPILAYMYYISVGIN